MGHKPGSIGLGNLTGLKPVTKNTTTKQKDNVSMGSNDLTDEVEDDSTTNNTTYCTKIMRITPDTFEKLRDFSHKWHEQPISFDEIIDELCSFYEEQHKQKYF